MSEEMVECGFCHTRSNQGQDLCPACGACLPLIAGGSAWERRRESGLVAALFQTVKDVFRSPTTVFAALRGGPSQLGAIILAVILGFFSSLIQAIWTMVLAPAEAKAALGGVLQNFSSTPLSQSFLDDAFRAIMLGQVVFSPLFAVLSLYLETALVWLALRLTGARGQRFSVVLLILAVSEISSLAVVIPQLGGLLSMVLGIVFLTIGLNVRFRLGSGRALLCALAPSIVVLLLLMLGSGAVSVAG